MSGYESEWSTASVRKHACFLLGLIEPRETHTKNMKQPYPRNQGKHIFSIDLNMTFKNIYTLNV